MQLDSVLLLILAAPSLLLLLFAWRSWNTRDRQMVHGIRRLLFVSGAVATVTSILFFVWFTLESPAHEHYYLTLRTGLWAGTAGVVLCGFGKGKGRVWGTVSGVLIWVVWAMFAATPP
jgi:hypothetical protein